MATTCTAVAVYGFRAPAPRRIEHAGIAYECNLVRDLLALGLNTAPVLKNVAESSSTDSSSQDLSEASPQDFMDKDDDKYYKYVSRLDPNEWKEQDHYRVLGLGKLRFRATMGQIKTAYRQKVLVYHPDKGKATKNGSRNEMIFACIQKAYEQVGLDDNMKRSYDSVDPRFDESMPEASAVNKNNFYEVLGSVFDRNSRFSVQQPVPSLGDADSSREHVENFYEFWLHFNSWREFSYKDTEDKSKGEDRRERREIEKMNRVEREQLRKKYVKRLSALVETAYDKDPRVALFKEQDRKAKQDEKDRRQNERRRIEEEKRQQELEEQRLVEEEKQRRAEEEKRETAIKQKARKALQFERKRLRDLLRSKDHFTDDTNVKLRVMENVERICLNCTVEELIVTREKLESVNDLENAMEILSDKGQQNEKENGTAKKLEKDSIAPVQACRWTQEEVQLLIKAANLYPAGSVERWTQVTKYVNDHASTAKDKPKTDKDIIKQVKIMKSAEATAALANIDPTPSVYATQQSTGQPTIALEADLPPPVDDGWSAEQQKQLEAALKSTDAKDPQRWEKIADAVTDKTKKQCMQRYKKLVQMIKDAKTKN